MPLVTSEKMLSDAQKGGYAVGAFNVENMEMAKAVIAAAEEMRSPVMLQTTPSTVKYGSLETFAAIVKAEASKTDIPVCLHLDHGNSFELAVQAMKAGYTSVMIDGSHETFEENVALTKKVVEVANAYGVPVEAELGKVGGKEDDLEAEADHNTDPEEAKEFVERTGVDSLAIAIGTSHGAYKFKGKPELDFARLEKISNLLPNFPLVLHGASTVIPAFVEECNRYGGKLDGAQGVPEDMLLKAGKYGVCKINIDTDLRLAMTASIRKYLAEHPEDFDPRSYLGAGRQAIKDMVSHKMRDVLNSSHRL